MMVRNQRAPAFQAEKALAAVSYLTQQTGADLYSVMKMLYLADKDHLGRFGRTITGDMYTAMKNGPVPDRAYNLCKFVGGRRSHYDALPTAREHLVLRDNVFELLQAPDLCQLSKSDLRALDGAAAIYAEGGWRAVRKASHDPAWKAYWAEAQAQDLGSKEMDITAIAATLPNGPAVIEYLCDSSPGEATAPAASEQQLEHC